MVFEKFAGCAVELILVVLVVLVEMNFSTALTRKWCTFSSSCNIVVNTHVNTHRRKRTVVKKQHNENCFLPMSSRLRHLTEHPRCTEYIFFALLNVFLLVDCFFWFFRRRRRPIEVYRFCVEAFTN